MKYGYEVKVSTTADGMVVSEVDSVFEGIHQNIMRQVVNTNESSVRAALVALGWAPPNSLPSKYKNPTAVELKVMADQLVEASCQFVVSQNETDMDRAKLARRTLHAGLDLIFEELAALRRIHHIVKG